MYIKRKITAVLEKYLEREEVLVLTGFRRVGKTTIIKYLFDNLPTSNKLFLDLESPVNQRIFQTENYDSVVSKLISLGLKPAQRPAYLFLDEIQFVSQTPSLVKYLYDHYGLKFILTGSSSFYLKNLFSESLAGRKFVFELFPLDFEEFLWFKEERLSLSADYLRLKPLYDEYLEFGGLPSVVLAKDSVSKKLSLDDILGSYFQLDVTHLAGFRDLKNLKSLLFLLASRAGNKVEVTKLSQTLNVSRQTIYNYLEFLEKTYLIHLISPYSQSSDVMLRRIPKLFFVDSGLLNQVGQVSEGQILENTVLNQLWLKSYWQESAIGLTARVNYWQKKSGAEIDFIMNKKGYEVKLTGTLSDFNRLQRLAKPLNLTNCQVVSLNQVIGVKNIIYPWNL